MLHQLLGQNEIFTNLKFEVISTLPYEYRGTVSLRLDQKGNLTRPYNQQNDPEFDNNHNLDTASLCTPQ